MARRLDPRPAPDLRYTEAGRRVRARLGGVDVADSPAPLLVWEPGRPVPLYAVPSADLLAGALEPADALPQRAHPVARAWDVVVDGRRAPAAAWTYDDEQLADAVVLDWNAMDAWFEEDDEVFVHPRDPFHRVDVRGSSRHVRIDVAGTTLGETSDALMLFETGLPVRFYLPPADVAFELLDPSPTRTRCPYKGEASYWSARVDGRVLDDLVWCYADPLADVERIAGRPALFDERVNVWIDGELQERPRTPWSRPDEEWTRVAT